MARLIGYRNIYSNNILVPQGKNPAVCDASGDATCFVARPINNGLPENINKLLV